MKSYILTSIMAVGAATGAFAEFQDATVINNIFATYLSPNGKYLGSSVASVDIYNVESKKITNYPDVSLGLGNSIANDGLAVGDIHDIATFIEDGIPYTPVSLRDYNFCTLQAVTPEATRVIGTITNKDAKGGEGLWFVPFYCDIDKNHNTSAPVLLPFPERDFYNLTPQYGISKCISADGKTILAQIVDNYGENCPVMIYTQNGDGSWEYVYPTRSLFNPDKIELPENPYLNEPPFPEPENFMSADSYEQYQEALWDWEISGADPEDMPQPTWYMTNAQLAAYEEAIRTYLDWYETSEGKIREFEKAVYEIQYSSALIGHNDVSMNLNGTVFAASGYLKGECYMWVYTLNETGEWEGKAYNTDPFLSFDGDMLCPHQVLNDGTIVAVSTRMYPYADYPLKGFILLPGAENFISISDYLASINPEAADWLKEFAPNGEGQVIFNEEMTTMCGGVTLGDLPQINIGDYEYFYYSYIINLNGGAGVESVGIEPNEGIYRVFNLQGIKVMETENPADINSLGKGIYIINGKKIVI